MKKSNPLELIANIEYSGMEIKQLKLIERIGSRKAGHWR